MFIEPHLFVSTGVAIFEHRSALQQAAKKLWFYVSRGRFPIVVFGPGGVGKSTLGKFLSSPQARLTSMAKYEQSRGTEEFHVHGPVVASIYVPPGQDFRRPSTWPELYTLIGKQKRVLVVNIVSNGYHVLSVEPDLLGLLSEPNAKRKDVLHEYVTRGRKRELDIAREIIDHLCNVETKISMLTVVTKQDLWWGQREQVRKHYESGTYSTHLKRLSNAKGAQRFHHEFVSASLVMTNLCTEEGELVFPTAQGYDEIIQIANQRNLVDTLHTLIRAPANVQR